MILDVRGLRTYFFTYDGVVKALDGVTFQIHRGETLGLVGETGCGKSVTAFSITKLIADPPGRIMDGQIRFKGANLLFGLEKEATFKPIRKSNRVKVRRRYRRIKVGQERMTAVRGAGISMIFQEPMSALNPIFSIADQISEALFLHRGIPIIDRLLKAKSRGAEVEAALQAVVDAARTNDGNVLRTACNAFAEVTGVPSLGTQAYYTFRAAHADPESKVPQMRKALRRVEFSGLQKNYLSQRRRRLLLEAELKASYMEEMRTSKMDRNHRRVIRTRRLALNLSTLHLSLWGIKRYTRKGLADEMFWNVVALLEGVSIANPVQVARGYPHELSGGMLQRVMIAMALSAEPELLVADEPTTALDVTIQAQILELMRDLKGRVGTAILLITHDLGVIAEVADRVCVMYAGNVVETAPVEELFRRPLHPYTQGLLSSIPRMDEPDKKLESIPGSVPNLIYPPTGCRFHPRCPHAMPVCKENRPPMTIEGGGHTVACYLYNGPTTEG
ncbi:MAG: ATP-binding cassette domain-containing protein [Thermoplasmata archaeon]|nr:ATP-binding cassette domain-containing protein [Thermoplasmata archaeon]MCI4332576.1 ATP-binding cassette domain-containing protein [Thermoplasmata archaeon]